MPISSSRFSSLWFCWCRQSNDLQSISIGFRTRCFQRRSDEHVEQRKARNPQSVIFLRGWKGRKRSVRSDFLSKAPSKLNVSDLDDFCSLANLYASNTPQSFRKVRLWWWNRTTFLCRNFIRVFLTISIGRFLKKRIRFIKRCACPFPFKNYFKRIN